MREEGKHIPNYEQPITGVTWLVPEQCRDCVFRWKGKVTIKDLDYELGKLVEKTYDFGEDGWRKGNCHIFPYPQMKPYEVEHNTGECEYYEKEKQRRK